MTKAEWLLEGKALGAKDSINGWEIGKWIIRGEEEFFSVPSSKKAKRAFFNNCRADWKAFIREAEEVTNLKETTLRQYARVVRNGLRVDGLSLAHHIEVLRAHRIEKSKRLFDFTAAREILNLALTNKWSALATRADAYDPEELRRERRERREAQAQGSR